MVSAFKTTQLREKKAYKCVKSTMREVVKTTKPLTIFSTLKEAKLLYGDVCDKVSKLTGERVIDLVLHIPVNYELWSKVKSFAEIGHYENCCVETTIDEIVAPKYNRVPGKIKTTTFDGYKLELYFFNYFPNVTWQIGQRIVVKGKVLIDNNGKRRMANPSMALKLQGNSGCIAIFKLKQLEDDDFDFNTIKIDNIEPIYSLGNGLKQNQIIAVVNKVLSNDRFDFSQLDACDYLLQRTVPECNIPSTKESLMRLHYPKSINDIRNNSIFLQKLAFLELLSFQYEISKIRATRSKEKGIVISGNQILRNKVLQNLPFSLTRDQNIALDEIYKDQASEKKWLRLLQGDVGSGKTVVALMSALDVVESGYKVVIMAPTAILAKQHFATVQKFCFGTGISVELLIGETRQKTRKDVLTRMKLGQVDILVGTHTLFQSKIDLPKNVGLFIIDEQHNFGVEQRASLIQKCRNADILMMTATPIPRTMVMGLYGDIDVSCIKHKPSDRLPIITSVLNFDEKYTMLVERIKKKIELGEKIYWVCPLVEESEKLEYIDVSTRAQEIEKVVDKAKIGVLHGKMSQENKDKMMLDFKNGNIQLLISTTVIEVGIDVPDATIIVIENAEKFGLAQLHQLRGRVGRGSKQSYCILLYGNKISQVGKSRLDFLKNHYDGFEVAEFDLKLRGGGTLLDKKQSGFKTTNFVDFSRDKKLVQYLNKANVIDIDEHLIQPIVKMFYSKNPVLTSI